jgi:hypothetical protein
VRLRSRSLHTHTVRMLSPVQLLLLLLALTASQCVSAQLQLPQCSSERQIVMCGQLPVDTAAGVAAYTECCARHEPFVLPPHAQEATSQVATSTAAVAATIPRPDLDLTPTGRYATPPDFLWTSTAIAHDKPVSTCVPKGQLLMPSFSLGQQVTVNSVTAPILSSTQISRVKARALALIRNVPRSVRRAALTLRIQARTAVPEATGLYTHPAGLMGAAELALMQNRIAASTSPQAEASVYMLSGATVSGRAQSWQQYCWLCHSSHFMPNLGMCCLLSCWHGSEHLFSRMSPAHMTPLVHVPTLMHTGMFALLRTPPALSTHVQVPPKFYRYNESIVWNPPTDCPASWVPGPYAMAKSSMK